MPPDVTPSQVRIGVLAPASTPAFCARLLLPSPRRAHPQGRGKEALWKFY